MGADADIVVYDPNRKHTISATTHHMDVDYSCYEGREVTGGSDIVLSRGTVVVENGAWTGPAGHGRFIKRDHRRPRPRPLIRRRRSRPLGTATRR